MTVEINESSVFDEADRLHVGRLDYMFQSGASIPMGQGDMFPQYL